MSPRSNRAAALGLLVSTGFLIGVSFPLGKLAGAATDGGGTLTLAPVDPVTFRAEEVPGLKVVFQVEAGKVTGLNIDQGGSTIPLTKKETP